MSTQPKVRIRLESDNIQSLNFVINQIQSMSDVLKMKFIGPIAMPTKRLSVTTRKTPCGDGSDTYERWEKRISRRLIEVIGDNKTQDRKSVV